jgi:PBP1b-binding outer membrane lipoprotein LpoB
MIRLRTNHALARPTTTIVAGVAAALLLAGCASSPPAPDAAMSAAKQAITDADQAHVAPVAAPALAEARSKLDAADAAIKEQKMIRAERLAQESRVDAELAMAQTTAAKDQAANDDMLKSTDAVSDELNRNGGTPQ